MKLMFIAIASAGLIGCAAVHRQPDYGEKTDAWKKSQRVYAEPANEKVDGLDSEEASMIHGKYRENMGGAAQPAPTQPPRVLILDEEQGGKNKK